MHVGTLAALHPKASMVDSIVDLIRRRLGNQVRNFGFTVQHAGLILTGRARTYYGKQIAQHVAMEMTGCAIAANRIEVRELEATAFRP